MDKDPDYIRVFSLHLSRTLDNIGINTRTVKQRRGTYLYTEQVINMLFIILEEYKNYSWYHFGSQTEGATTPGLRSDMDNLILCREFNVIREWGDWEQGKQNLLILQENTAPGYCRLQLLRSDIPTARKDVPCKMFTFDKTGKVIMNNTWIHKIQVRGMNGVRNGPARSDYVRPDITDSDYVYALGCRSWPHEALAFERRQRQHDWPTQRLIQQAGKQGVFLVPVGHKLSPTEHLEWRLSASLAERCLMFSLSIVHIKCYVVLKLLMKTFVEPQIGKCISSYHCKTALLYCTENTEPGFWREDNLLQCATQCLLKLLSWVNMEFCPQFVIFEENLFDGKVTVHNRGPLQAVLAELIKRSDNKLTHVLMDDLGVKLKLKLYSSPNIPVLDSLSTMRLLAHFDHDKLRSVHYVLSCIQNHTNMAKLSAVVCFVNQTIGMLNDRMRLSNKHELLIVQTLNESLYRWLGSILASLSISRKTSLSRMAIKLLNFGGVSDVASVLKIASVFYCNGDAGKARAILDRLEQFYGRNELEPICVCNDIGFHPSLAFCRELFTLKSKRKRNTRFAFCVRFYPIEKQCAPPELRYEMFRSVGEDMKRRLPINDIWMDVATVDSLPYLYFLQYMTNRQLGQGELQTRALHNLKRCIRESFNNRHLETSWNLLGQCLELEQQSESAMACYRRSLQIRPRSNAANWHVTILCYRLIQIGRSPI